MAVNAPEGGIIKEFMANEDDTVTVDQEIARIEPGEAPEGGAKPESKEPPKEEAASTEAKPAEPKQEENKPAPKQEEPKSAPAPKKETPASKQDSKPAKDDGPTLGSREERRVRWSPYPTLRPRALRTDMPVDCRSR